MCCSPDDKVLCAGFDESHLMMWSLTPQPLPCRSDGNAVNTHHLTDPGDSGDADETRQRFLLSLHVLCLLVICLYYSAVNNYLHIYFFYSSRVSTKPSVGLLSDRYADYIPILQVVSFTEQYLPAHLLLF